MAIWLKQSTASQEVPLGYFVDSTDGDTEETGLTIANTDIKLWKTGATTLANKNSGGATHIANGIYYCTLDATDTNTLGPLVIFVHESGALTVRVECLVVLGAVYDSIFGSTGDLAEELSDIHSRLVVMEAAIDSDQLIVDAKTSDTHSRLVVIEAAIDSDQMIVDAKTSDTHSRLVVIEAAIDSDQSSQAIVLGDILSDTAIIEAEVAGPTGAISDIQSKLVDVKAETATIYSDTTVIEAGGGSLTSDQDSKLTATATAVLAGGTLEDMVSDTYSRLLVVESAIDSDHLIIGSDTAAIEAAGGALTSDQDSKLTAAEDHASDAHSRLVVVEAAIDSDQTSRTAAISNIHSRLVVIEAAIDSDQVSRTAAISDVKSELVVISDAVLAVDGAIDSDQVSRSSAISDVKSRLVVVEAAIDSDQLIVDAKTSDTHSRLVVIEAAIDSDQTSRATALANIDSQATATKSQAVVIASDAALLEAAHSEPTGVPAANESPLDKLAYLYMVMRNKVTVTATKKTVYDDGGAAEFEKDLSDDGTTYQETEANAI